MTSHGRALLAGDEGTAVVDADVRDPEGELGDPRVAELIGAGRPVCVLLVAVLHFFTDEQDPAGLLARYGDFVLLRPPLNKITALLWVGPSIAWVLALVAAFFFFRLQHSFVNFFSIHPFSAKLRQQGGVDVDDLSGPGANQGLRDLP